MIKFKINIYDLITYLLIFAIIKPYFLPNSLRLILKIIILIYVYFFIISKSKLIDLPNISLLFCGAILISGAFAFFKTNYTIRDFLDSILYAITFYDLYTFIGLCKRKGKFDKMLKAMYRIILLYCCLTVVSIGIVGIENNSNQAAYFFGNKFTSSYLFVLLISLYGSTHKMSEKKDKTIYFALFIFSILLTLYVKCTTAAIALVILLSFNVLPNKIKLFLLNEKMVVIALILSSLIIIWIEKIFEIDFINKLVFDYFNKSYTVTGRFEIYSVYLSKVVLGSFWLGYGYSNSLMKSFTKLYSNAQNGLLEIFINFGFFGVIFLLITVFYCYKKTSKNMKTFYLSIVVYGMIIMAIFEVTLNWMFLLGLCLVRWNYLEKNREEKSL